MKKLICLLLAMTTIFMLAACGKEAAPEAEAEKKVEEPVVEEVKVVDAKTIEEAVQGVWLLNGTNKFTFEGNNFDIDATLKGTFVVDVENSIIKATAQATDGQVSIKIPYTYENDTLTIFNNQGVALVKQ